MKIKTILLLLVLTASGNAKAAFYSGDELLAECESPHVAIRNICSGFLTGVNDSQESYVTWDILSGPNFCIPLNVTQKQLQKVLVELKLKHNIKKVRLMLQ